MDSKQRFRAILEQQRAERAPDFPADLLAEMAEIEDANQFDDDRNPARKLLRAAVDQRLRQGEESGVDQPRTGGENEA